MIVIHINKQSVIINTAMKDENNIMPMSIIVIKFSTNYYYSPVFPK